MIYEYNLYEVVLKVKDKYGEFEEFEEEILKEEIDCDNCILAKTGFLDDKEKYCLFFGLEVNKEEIKSLYRYIFDEPFIKEWCDKVIEKRSNIDPEELIKELKKPLYHTISYDDVTKIIIWDSVIDLKVKKLKV